MFVGGFALYSNLLDTTNVYVWEIGLDCLNRAKVSYENHYSLAVIKDFHGLNKAGPVIGACYYEHLRASLVLET